ncbi:MAG: glycosyltransferase family 9 protein [Syntrophobacterales bacterium]|nr:glycosyltransferase family 9 protein [Syntrophobacterales bacterium]
MTRPAERHPGEILVINLMRLGDLVQSSPVLRGLRSRHPQARITFLAMDLFAGAARLLPGVDRLLLFPGTELAPVLDREGWPAAVRRLADWARRHLWPRPELVVNLTPTVSAGLVARLSAGAELRGLWVSDGRELATSPAWASYSLVVSKARQANPFNVVDLFVRSAGLLPDGRGLAVQVPGVPSPRAGGPVQVGLCPGASRPERQWPPENFAAAARLLLDAAPCRFLIFGSAGERPLGEALLSLLPPGSATLLAGETDLPDLARRLAELDLLITNDTGPMHLAAAVGTPVVALFLASARAQDTGPAGRGHAVLEPHLACHPCLRPCARPRCHAAISPEAVAQVAVALLTGPDRELRDPTGPWGSIRLYHTTLDPEGHQALLPGIRRPLSREDFWRGVHRLAWEEFLQAPPAPRLAEWLADLWQERFLLPEGGLPLPDSLAALAELISVARRGEETAARLAHRTCRAPLPAALSTVTAIDQALRRLAAAHPELAAPVAFFFQDQRRATAREVPALARDLSRAYGRLRRLGELLQDAALRLAPAGLRPALAQPLQVISSTLPRSASKSEVSHAHHHQ